MTNINKQPRIRFEGYQDDWEQRKFEDVFEFPVATNSLSRSQLNYENGLIKSVHYGDILIKYNSILDIKKDPIPYINEGTLEKYNSNLLKNGDIIFADAAEDETVGKAVEVIGLTDENLVAGLHTIVARSKGIKGPYFLGYYINSDAFHHQLLRLMQGTKVSSISKGSLKETKVCISSNFEEQQKIGTFFKELDDTIALHQEKLELLKKMKKSYLQKMFPKKDETVPKIRFAGFTDDWEQRKLGEMSENFEYGLNSAAIPFDGENKYLRITDIDDSSNLFKKDSLTSPDADLESSDNYLLKKDDILFARTGASVGKTYRYQEDDGKVYYAGFLIRARIKPQFDSEFVFQNTLTSLYSNFIKVTSQRSGQPGVNAKEYGEFVICMPILEEQQKIGTFFKQLDDTIALHQEKLELLKETKTSFLQKMFV